MIYITYSHSSCFLLVLYQSECCLYLNSVQRADHYFYVRAASCTNVLLLFLKALVLFRFPQICSEAVDNIGTIASLNNADIFIDKLDHLLDATSRYAQRVR